MVFKVIEKLIPFDLTLAAQLAPGAFYSSYHAGFAQQSIYGQVQRYTT